MDTPVAIYNFGLTVHEMWNSSPTSLFELRITSIYLPLDQYLCPVLQRDGQCHEAISFSKRAKRISKELQCDGLFRYRMDTQNRWKYGWLS